VQPIVEARAGREAHREEVITSLAALLGPQSWELSCPHGSGHETYFATALGQDLKYFVKVGASVEHAIAMADEGLSPPVLAISFLGDGASILVQQFIEGRTPTWSDYRSNHTEIATALGKMHRSTKVRSVLPKQSGRTYAELGAVALGRLRDKWGRFAPAVPDVDEELERSLAQLEGEIEGLTGSKLVVSHNDFCNSNLLITSGGKVYILDLEMMGRDDPASDLGAVLWWYYERALWPGFLGEAGYDDTPELRERMRLRMAVHTLSILLPRAGGFDTLDADRLRQGLTDFRAVLQDRSNPRGYED